MSRSSFLFVASVAIAIAACGDDTETTSSSGGGSSSSASTTATSSSANSSSASSSSQGGGTTSDGGGGAGQGGVGGDGGGGLGGDATLEQVCEDLNDTFVEYGEELECPPEFLGDCSAPTNCPDELRALIDCFRENIKSSDDCFCTGDPEAIFCPTPACDDLDDELFACEEGS